MNDETNGGGKDNGSSGTDDWAEALAEQTTSSSDPGSPLIKQKLDSLTDETQLLDGPHPNLDVIMEIPVTISMEVGKTQISIRNLLKLNQGSVVELDRYAGEPLDVYVNGTLIAHGEVVVVNEKFGIRLTDVVSTTERINKISQNL